MSTPPKKKYIKLEDVLLPDRRFNTKGLPGKLVTQATSQFIKESIAKDEKLKQLCLHDTESVEEKSKGKLVKFPGIRKTPIW